MAEVSKYAIGTADSVSTFHRRSRLLKQQLLITVYRLKNKENNFRFPFPFSANIRKFAISIFRLQQHFSLVPFSVRGIPEAWRWRRGE
jgi:hypothetical protein